MERKGDIDSEIENSLLKRPQQSVPGLTKARSLLWVSHEGRGAQGFVLPLATFPRHISMVLKTEQPGLDLAPIRDAGVAGVTFTYHIIMSGPNLTYCFTSVSASTRQ